MKIRTFMNIRTWKLQKSEQNHQKWQNKRKFTQKRKIIAELAWVASPWLAAGFRGLAWLLGSSSELGETLSGLVELSQPRRRFGEGEGDSEKKRARESIWGRRGWDRASETVDLGKTRTRYRRFGEDRAIPRLSPLFNLGLRMSPKPPSPLHHINPGQMLG